MGAYFRFYERSVERDLAANATRGVVQPSSTVRTPLGTPKAPGEKAFDRRQLVPPLGLREYWYPALPASRVKAAKPLYWVMLGEELAFFRNKEGGISAVSDVCPHRGASMSRGDCFYEGTVSCPYHGATFDAKGECVAFITEGPASRMVGHLKIRSYPTRVLRGWVWVWMGDGEPAPLEEDVPPEFLNEGESAQFHTYTYWPASWILAIENQNDAHNASFVHRNSLMQLMAPKGRRRTPIGPRSRLVEDRALIPLMTNQNYYANEEGVTPYQLYYPGVDGVWPLGKWRKAVWAVFKPWQALVNNKWRRDPKRYPVKAPDEWASVAGGSGWHLPCAIRVNFGYYMYTRYAVPVSANLSRVIYFHHRPKPSNWLSSLRLKAWFYGYFNYWLHYNFSGQDALEAAPCRYWTPENFAPTDSHLVLLRKLITERSRDARRAAEKEQEAAGQADKSGMSESEKAFFERQRAWGNEAEDDLERSAQVTAQSMSIESRPRIG